MWYENYVLKSSGSALQCDNVEILVAQLNVKSENVRYLDINASGGGDGLGQDTAWNDLSTAITGINSIGDIPKLLYVKPGTYTITSSETISTDYTYIYGANDVESTKIKGSFGSDLFVVSSDYNYIYGLQFYSDEDGLVFNAGSFNVVENCTFRSEVIGDMNYGIRVIGTEGNIIRNCYFQATANGAIITKTGTGGCKRLRVENSRIVGCSTGILIDGDAYNITSIKNTYLDGSESAGETYSRSINASASYTAGSIVSVKDIHQGANSAGSYTNNGIGALGAISPKYLISVP